jgi:hypothetical protein
MGFFSSLRGNPAKVACVLADTHSLVRQMASVLGFEVTKAPAYASLLVPAINSAVAYFDSQITEIPGPFDLSAQDHQRDSLVHALFPARQEIAHGLGRSMDVRQPLALLAGAEQKDVFALLGARCPLDRQIPGEAPVFADHTLRCLAASESGTRQAIRTAALGRLVADFGEHLARLREKGSLPRNQWNMENTPAAAPTEGAGEQFALAVDELKPEKLLHGLVAWLQRPAEYMQVRARKDVKPGIGQANPTHRIDLLPEMLSHDRRIWIVCIVHFSLDEGIAAVQRETRQHRYIKF